MQTMKRCCNRKISAYGNTVIWQNISARNEEIVFEMGEKRCRERNSAKILKRKRWRPGK